jgi:Fe-S cluster biogenesis protein NfuA
MTQLMAGGKPDVSDVPAQASDVERIEALIGILSDYIEHYHGGFVELVHFDGKTLQVRLGGACEGCDFAPQTLNGWIAGTIRPFFPDIESVEAVK